MVKFKRLALRKGAASVDDALLSPTFASPRPATAVLICSGIVALLLILSPVSLSPRSAHFRVYEGTNNETAAALVAPAPGAGFFGAASPPPRPPPSPPPLPLAPTWEDFGDPFWPGYRNQPPPDAWTARLEPPPASAVGASGRTPVAYILTINASTYRYRYTAVRAAAAGMRPVPHFGSWPRSDNIRPPGMQKLCATRFAHKTSWWRFVEDPDAGEQDWAFFFEDDVNLRLRGPAAHLAWRRAVAHPDVVARGIVYLGYCAASAAPNTTESVLVAADEATPFGPFPEDVRMNMACGSCQHAYGLRKDFARKFWSMGFLNIPQGDDACNTTHAEARGAGYRAHDVYRGPEVVNADTSAIYVCLNQLNGFPSVGFNLRSPQNQDQVGLYYQDRWSFASTLDANNYGVGSSLSGLKAEPSLDDARRRLQQGGGVQPN